VPPRDLILEPGEKILLATRPLYLWEPQVALIVVLVALSLYWSSAGTGLQWLGSVGAVIALGYALVLLVKWISWRGKWFVLTDRRVISRWGVLNRNQSAVLLDRIQDASLARPFPLSFIRDYGVLHLETAGAHSEERISEGLRELEMTGASHFYRALTDAQTPGR
jgi:uncharacterized membrane protein YdbT with pleckstrin-like domain